MRRYPHSFSGGQRQRIGLARAMALDAVRHSVRRADLGARRFSAGTDPEPAEGSAIGLGLSYLFVSHNLAVIDYMASEIAVMCRGIIVEQAPRDDPVPRSATSLHAARCWPPCPSPDLDHPLNFEQVCGGGFSDPGEWPHPFTLVPGQTAPAMIEVAPRHFVCMAAEDSAPLMRAAS